MRVPPAETRSAFRTRWRRRGGHVRVPPEDASRALRTWRRRRGGHMCDPPAEACTALRTRWRRRGGHLCRLQKREFREARTAQKRERREALPAQDGGASETRRRTHACNATCAARRSAQRSPHMVAETERTHACAARRRALRSRQDRRSRGREMHSPFQPEGEKL